MAQVDPYAEALADGIEAVLPTWVVTSVTMLVTAWAGTVPPDVAAAAEDAGQRARTEIGGAVRRLLQTDYDEQPTTPLALLRRAVRYPTEVLRAAGVPGLERDRFAEEAFPEDIYDLTPARFADIDPSLAEPGLVWGASKAFAHKRRHAAPPGSGTRPGPGDDPAGAGPASP